MKKQRKQYAPEEKVAILRRHLLEKEPISNLCDELGLQPTVSYRWQKEFFENGAAAFEQKARPNHSADQERIAYLEKKIQTKDEVLADLMAEHVAVKNFRLADSCKLEMFASAAVVRHALIMPAGVVSPSSALGPSTSRITTARSRNACAPLP
jgi:transposase